MLGSANSFSFYLPVMVYYRHVSWGELGLLLEPFNRASLLSAANLSGNQRPASLKGEALAPQLPARVIMKTHPSCTKCSLGTTGSRQRKARDQGSEQGKVIWVRGGWEGALGIRT